MNCKPDQMAWIVVPKRFYSNGIEQLHGRIVRTVRLLSGQHAPIWQVTPEQWVTITRRAIDTNGVVFSPGERVPAEGIPDAFLRPFDPDSEPKDENVLNERELTS